MTRPLTNIPQAPTPPYPIAAKNIPIIAGFGRGSSELGIPTANVPVDKLPKEMLDLEQGVYFGFAKLNKINCTPKTEKRKDGKDVEYKFGNNLNEEEFKIYPQVMSIGWNPFYGNKEKAVEIHIIHSFSDTFYGANLNFNVLGYIRPELNYTTKEALIRDIEKDIEIGVEMLESEGYARYKDL